MKPALTGPKDPATVLGSSFVEITAPIGIGPVHGAIDMGIDPIADPIQVYGWIGRGAASRGANSRLGYSIASRGARDYSCVIAAAGQSKCCQAVNGSRDTSGTG